MTADAEARRAALREAAHAEAVHRRHPANAQILLVAAQRCFQAGETARAAALADIAVAADPPAFASQVALASLLGALHRREEALAWAERACATRPNDDRAWLHRTSLLLALRRHRDAVDAAQRHLALSRLPSATGFHLLSVARAGCGDAAGAAEASRRAIGLAPDRIEYHRHLASVLVNDGRLAEALDAADAGVALEPQDAAAWRVRSGVLDMLGRHAAALVDAEKAVHLAPDNRGFAMHRDGLVRELGLARSDPGDLPASLRLPPPRRRGLPARPPVMADGDASFAAALVARGRAIHAILLREIRTRHARSRLGYVWALLEPIGHLATLGSVFFLLNHGPPPVGESLFLFYVTGLLPYLAFSHTTQAVSSARDDAGGLHHLPAVGPLDMAAARAELQLVTEIVVAALVLSGVALAMGVDAMPHSLPTTLAGLLCLWLMGCGMGLVGLVASDRMPAWDQFWNAVVRLLYFASGIYYSPLVMPAPVIEALEWNPILQGIEWVRSGFFAGYDPPWLDRGYALGFAIALFVLGLSLERATRHRLRRAEA